MKTFPDTIKIVEIHASRGWEPGFYEIIERRGSEFRVKNLNGGKSEWIYAAHCFFDRDTLRMQKIWLLERANRIGRKK